MSKIIKKSIGEAIYKEYFSMKFEDGSAKRAFFKLVYLGQDGNKFHIGYREYLGNVFRSDFSENFIFEVPHNNPIEISYKNKSFSIISVNNKEIDFRVL